MELRDKASDRWGTGGRLVPAIVIAVGFALVVAATALGSREVVRAGKDCYCEKPMANTLEDAKLARDAVVMSKQVVQMGSQWLSCPYQHRVRDIVRSGKLGKIVSISQSWNFNGPRWHVPKSEDVATIREQDTDWSRWLLGRGWRPFD